MSSSMAASVGFVELAGVSEDGIYHASFARCNDGQILGSNVVQ